MEQHRNKARSIFQLPAILLFAFPWIQLCSPSPDTPANWKCVFPFAVHSFPPLEINTSMVWGGDALQPWAQEPGISHHLQLVWGWIGSRSGWKLGAKLCLKETSVTFWISRLAFCCPWSAVVEGCIEGANSYHLGLLRAGKNLTLSLPQTQCQGLSSLCSRAIHPTTTGCLSHVECWMKVLLKSLLVLCPVT